VSLSRNIAVLFPLSAKLALRRVSALPARVPYRLASLGLPPTRAHRHLQSLRDHHAGRRGFVVGSGPSLNRMDLACLQGEITFVSNAFFLGLDTVGFRPTYLTVEDPLPAEDYADELNALTGITKIFAHDLRFCLEPGPETVFVFFDRYYLDWRHRSYPRFSPDALDRVYWGGTVAYMNLQLAWYMGLREVYLIGIDLDYTLPDHAEGDVIVSREADVSHFHPDYFGPGKRWHDPRVDRMARSFARAGEYFQTHGGALYNATVGGRLESLPRVDFANLF